MARFLILGCGWVGEAFAKLAIKLGQEVVATVTSAVKAERLCAQGITAIVHDFDQISDLAIQDRKFDYVLNSIPASKKFNLADVEDRFRHVAEVLRSLSYQKHIYLSSIGIYPEQSRSFDESYQDEDQMNTVLLQAEQIMRSAINNTIVFRLGGLFGQERIFAKYFANKICNNGAQSANFIHQEDVSQLIWLGFTQQQALSQSVYNLVCPQHPTKEAVIRASAAKYGYDLPVVFEQGERYDKVVSGDLIIQELQYSFKYPSPLDF